jgi:hypothetical protein
MCLKKIHTLTIGCKDSKHLTIDTHVGTVTAAVFEVGVSLGTSMNVAMDNQQPRILLLATMRCGCVDGRLETKGERVLRIHLQSRRTFRWKARDLI